jgi:hypothetical protein
MLSYEEWLSAELRRADDRRRTYSKTVDAGSFGGFSLIRLNQNYGGLLAC